MLTNRYVMIAKAPKIIPQIKRALQGEAVPFLKVVILKIVELIRAFCVYY
jgi:hypothetical protein